MVDEGKNFQLIDIREEYEYDACNLNGALIPMGEIIDRTEEIAKTSLLLYIAGRGQGVQQFIKYLVHNMGLQTFLI